MDFRLVSLLLFATSAALTAHSQNATAAARLDGLRHIFSENLVTIVAKYGQAVGEWPERYLDALRALQTRYQRAGDLENWKVVQAEVERFQTAWAIPSSAVVERPALLKETQTRFRAAKADYLVSRSREILALRDRYLVALTRLQTELTKKGEIRDALMVNREVDRARALPEARAAEAELARNAEERRDDPAPARSSPPQPDATNAPPAVTGPAAPAPQGTRPNAVEEAVHNVAP